MCGFLIALTHVHLMDILCVLLCLGLVCYVRTDSKTSNLHGCITLFIFF